MEKKWKLLNGNTHLLWIKLKLCHCCLSEHVQNADANMLDEAELYSIGLSGST